MANGILDERIDERMGVQDVRRGLLPLRGVGHDVVQMAVDDFPDVAARPEVHLGRRARPAPGLVPGKLGFLASRGVRLDGAGEGFDHPAVVG